MTTFYLIKIGNADCRGDELVVRFCLQVEGTVRTDSVPWALTKTVSELTGLDVRQVFGPTVKEVSPDKFEAKVTIGGKEFCATERSERLAALEVMIKAVNEITAAVTSACEPAAK